MVQAEVPSTVHLYTYFHGTEAEGVEQGRCQDTPAHTVHSRRDPGNSWNTNTITAYWMSPSQNQQRWKQGETCGFPYTWPEYRIQPKTQATSRVRKIVTDYPRSNSIKDQTCVPHPQDAGVLCVLGGRFSKLIGAPTTHIHNTTGTGAY